MGLLVLVVWFSLTFAPSPLVSGSRKQVMIECHQFSVLYD